MFLTDFRTGTEQGNPPRSGTFSSLIPHFCSFLIISLFLFFQCFFNPLSAETYRVTPLNLDTDLANDEEVKLKTLDGKKAWRTGSGTGKLIFDGADLEHHTNTYDYLKMEVKADEEAFGVARISSHPADGATSKWYFLDGMRDAFGWRTIWLDLKKPEGLDVDDGSGKGKGKNDADPLLKIRGHGYTVRNLRLVREAVHLDWDLRKAPYTWEKGKDLTYHYPLTVKNKVDRKLTAKLSLEPFDVEYATAELERESVALKPGEEQTVEARIRLPADVAERKEPLYCERFSAIARAKEFEDSTVTLLTSADPIYLSVTVPVPEDQLSFPLLGRRKTLPENIHKFPGMKKAKEQLANTGREDLRRAIREGGLENGWFDVLNWIKTYNGLEPWPSKEKVWGGSSWKKGVNAAAFLHDFTGDQTYAEKGGELLLEAEKQWTKEWRTYSSQKFQLVSRGLLCDNTLHLAFRIAGTTRPPYSYNRHGALNSFDLIASELNPQRRERIIRNWILPMGIQIRGHYIGPGNQQLHQNYVTLYAGLAARNWPLVSFAYSSSHGLLANLERAFGPDGLAKDAEHHNYAIHPLLWTTELLYRTSGVNLYNERLHTILHSKAAEELDEGYNYDSMTNFVENQRFSGKEFLVKDGQKKEEEGTHLTGGLTTLRWNGLEVLMNWRKKMYRGCPAKCALTIRGGGLEMGGIVGSLGDRSTFGNSVLIVDESAKQPDATPTSVDVSGPVQHIQAKSKTEAAPWITTRTFALLGRHVLAVDRVSSEKPRTVDWLLRDAPAAPELDLDLRKGSFTNKPSPPDRRISFGAELNKHRFARADGSWSTADGRFTMLGTEPSSVFYFNWKWQYDQGDNPTLMIRRKDVRRTDFVTFISKADADLHRLPVRKTGGGKADAIAVKIVLKNGSTMRAIVNYEDEGTGVTTEGLTTHKRFATDYEE